MNKNNGFTLVEATISIFLFVVTSYFIISNYTYELNKIRSYNVKNRIITMMNYVQKKSYVDNKLYNISFNLDKKQIEYIDNILKLDDTFLYECLGSDNSFIRHTTHKGNLDKGFTIIIKDKKNKIIYNKISYNTTNGLNLSVLNHEN